MAVQPRPAWFLPMARQAAPAPIPDARPTAPSAPAPRPSIVQPAFPSQPQEPNPPPPPADASPPSTDAPPPSSPASAAAPPRSPVEQPAPTTAPPRSPVASPALAPPTPKSPMAPRAPVPSTPRSPFAPPPLVNISPSASKSPTVKASNSLPTSPAPKVSPTTNVLSPSIPSSPKTQTLDPSSSVPTSPAPKPIATPTRNGLVPGQAATPASSPKIVEPLATTPVQSPKTKVASRPPSPLTLPPSQIKTESAHETMMPSEVEQKLVLVQETVGDPVMPNTHDDGIASNEKRELKKDKGANKKLFDSKELRTSMITLAGENKGAIMELSPTPKNHYSTGDPHSLHKTISIKGGTEDEQSSIDRSELKRYKDKLNKAKATQSTPITAIINSNFQGVNNAILYDCTFTHQDPGVHHSLTGNGTGGNGIHLADH